MTRTFHFALVLYIAAVSACVADEQADGDATPDGALATEHLAALQVEPLATPTAPQPAIAEELTAPPSIGSIGGVTNAFGLADGLYSTARLSGCGDTAYNGYRVINDVAGAYPWTLYGANFGTARGSITLGSMTVPIQSWTATSIRIDPTAPYYAVPTSLLLTVRRADGATVSTSVSVAPSIRTRVYKQCTYHVAKRRLEMGRQPSATSYGGYAALEQWSPMRGDQLHWNGAHTAIIESIGLPIAGPFGSGETTIPITISQSNVPCGNGVTSYSTRYKYRVQNNVRTVLERPKYSANSGGASGYYR